MTEKELLDKAVEEKLIAAEKRISVVRLVLILFNSVIYLAFMERQYTFPTLAYSIIVVATIYSILSLFLEPYKHWKFVRTSYFTTVTDGALIALWIIATGCMDSPFYVIWYISVVAVALRYSLKEVAISTLIYILLYMGIFLYDNSSYIEIQDLMVRLGYIPIAGMLGMILSMEIGDQIQDKVAIIKGESALQEAHHKLEKRVAERTEELQLINNDLTDSINYANRIQNAILPPIQELKNSFKDAFVLYLPRDIISGDFYWFHEKGNVSFIAVVDCTGHGVPGALMSMIGNDLLNHIIIDKRITEPDKILSEMDKAVARLLQRENGDIAVNDGMDMSLCVIDHDKCKLTYAGAQNIGLLYGNNGLTVLKANKDSIGGLMAGTLKDFQCSSIPFNKGDRLYLFTDGYQDQFGGPRGKKFFKKNFIGLIENVSDKPMEEQMIIIQKTFNDWKGEEMQIDDVTVLGVAL